MRAALQLVITLLNLIPFTIRLRLARCLGLLFSVIPTRERKIAKLQAELIHKKYPLAPCISQAYASLAQSIAECLDLESTLMRCKVSWHGAEHLQQLKSSKSAALFLSAHTANWELLAADTVRRGAALHVIGRSANYNYLQEILSGIRSKCGVKTIWRNERGAAKRIISALARGEQVGALIDQDTEVESTFVDFFGRPAKVPLSVVEIALRREVPIFSILIFRDSLLGSTVFFEPFAQRSSATAILLEFNRRLEKYISLYPEQWVWFHKRWRTLPNGVKLSSAEYIKFLRHEIALS